MIADFFQIVVMAMGILIVQLTLIVLGSRYGWFLWAGKKVLSLLRRNKTGA